MIWLTVHLSRIKPYRPLTGTPLSVGAFVVTKTRFRVVYLTLTTSFALPLVLNLWANFVANSWKRHWPYFALATAFAVAALVRNELRRHPAAELGAVADRLARSINEQWSAEAAARRINDPTRLPVPWKVVRERAFDPWSEVIELQARCADPAWWTQTIAFTAAAGQCGVSEKPIPSGSRGAALASTHVHGPRQPRFHGPPSRPGAGSPPSHRIHPPDG